MEQNFFEKIEELLANRDEAEIKKEILRLTPFEIARVINRIQRGKRKLWPCKNIFGVINKIKK